MHDLIEMMLKKWGYLYNMHGIELIYHPLNGEWVWMSNDFWLQRLFDNVFQNVLNHSKADKLVITIENNVVSIKDNGIGFDIENESKGLGLKIIEDIAKTLYIKYNLESNECGTLFKFYSRKNDALTFEDFVKFSSISFFSDSLPYAT